jgi:membrane protein YdbS with pleckstrin-like domain
MKRRKKSSLKRVPRVKTGEGQPLLVFPSFLLPEERIIFKVNPHWLYVMVPELALILIGYLILKFLPAYWPEQIHPVDKVLMIFGLLWVLVMVIVFLDWFCIRYYLTNLRLIEERGIIGKRIMSIWLDKVQDVTCKFGILGRIFGFGEIEIESAGTYGRIVFGFLPSPRKLREEIEEAVLNFHQHRLHCLKNATRVFIQYKLLTILCKVCYNWL